MSDSVLLAVLLGVWLLTGLLLAEVLGRRRHDPFDWLVLGTLMGPVAIFLALDAVECDEQLVNVVPFDTGQIDDREARSKLLEATPATQGGGIGLEVTHGDSAAAMQQLIQRDHYDVLVVGTSTDDRVHALGDGAVDLARDGAVSVLLLPTQPDRRDR